jgi:hypothetical protein
VATSEATTYVLIAIIEKELQLDASLYTYLLILSVSILKKRRFHAPCSKLSQNPICTATLTGSFCSTSNRTLVGHDTYPPVRGIIDGGYFVWPRIACPNQFFHIFLTHKFLCNYHRYIKHPLEPGPRDHFPSHPRAACAPCLHIGTPHQAQCLGQ